MYALLKQDQEWSHSVVSLLFITFTRLLPDAQMRCSNGLFTRFVVPSRPVDGAKFTSLTVSIFFWIILPLDLKQLFLVLNFIEWTESFETNQTRELKTIAVKLNKWQMSLKQCEVTFLAAQMVNRKHSCRSSKQSLTRSKFHEENLRNEEKYRRRDKGLYRTKGEYENDNWVRIAICFFCVCV